MELIELVDVNWGKVEETVDGLGKKLIKELDTQKLDDEEAMEQRLKIWRAAINMCEEDKASFWKEVQETHKSMVHMTHPVKFSRSLKEVSPSELKAIVTYVDEVKDMDMGTVTAGEISINKKNLSNLEEQVSDLLSAAKKNGQKALAIKGKLIS